VNRSILHLILGSIALCGALVLWPDPASSQVDPFRDCAGKPYQCSGPNGSCCGKHGCTVDEKGGCTAW
jgi:hypothetical protein